MERSVQIEVLDFQANAEAAAYHAGDTGDLDLLMRKNDTDEDNHPTTVG